MANPSILAFQKVAGDNDDAVTGVNWLENQAPSTLNDSARALMARLAYWRDWLAGNVTQGGATNAYTFTSGETLTAYSNSLRILWTPNHNSSGAVTLNVDGIGAKKVFRPDGTQAGSGDIIDNTLIDVVYRSSLDGGAGGFQIIGGVTEATALSMSGQYKLVGRSSASAGLSEEISSSADVFAILGAANNAAVRALLDLEAGTDFYSKSAADTLLAAKVDTTTTLTAGLGLSGGGDLSTGRSFALDFSELTDTAIATGDGLTFMDVSDSNNPKRRTVSSVITDLSLAALGAANVWTAAQTHRSSAGNFGGYWTNDTQTDQMGWYFGGATGSTWKFLPRPAGSSDTAREFGFNFTTLKWDFDEAPTVAGVSVMTVAGGAFTGGITVNNAGNAVRWGHTNTDYFIQGYSNSGGGTPFLGFNVGQGASANTHKTAGANKGIAIGGQNGYLAFYAFNSTSTDNIATPTEFLTIRGDVSDVRLIGTPTALDTTSIGTRGLGSPAQKGAGYTFAIGDAAVLHQMNDGGSNAFTIPPNSSVAFPVGTVIPVQNVHATGTCTIAEGSGVTLSRGDGTSGTGTRTLLNNGAIASLVKESTNGWRIVGPFT